MREHPGHRRVADERLHDGRSVGPGHEEVDVADRLLHPPKRARVGHATGLRQRRQHVDEDLGHAQCDVDLDPAPGGLELADPSRDVLLRLGAEPRERRHPVLFDRGDELVHRADAELPIEHHRLLRAQPRDRHHVANPRRDLLPKRLELGHGPGREELFDLLPDRTSHRRDLQDLGHVLAREIHGIAADRARGFLIGARLVRIVEQDRQQVGVLDEHRLDGVVRPGHLLRLRRRGGAAAPSVYAAGSRPDPTRRTGARRSPRR